MATPRQQGLLAEARALQAAASDFGNQDLIAGAQALYDRTLSYLASPVQFLQSNPQSDIDAMGSGIGAAVGVNPLDVDSSADLSPASAGNLTDAEKVIASGTGGNYAAATNDAVQKFVKDNNPIPTIGSALKWILYLGVAFVFVYFLTVLSKEYRE